MATPPIPNELLQEVTDWVEQYGSTEMAIKALSLKIPRTTLQGRHRTAMLKGFRPTFKKEAPRIHSTTRLGKMHIVVPDTQVRPGVNTDHLEWAGNYIAEKRPDVIVHLGDHWDLPSLSSYDKGKLSFEGRRYVNDVKAGHDGMQRLIKPWDSIPGYNPRRVFLRGNHCYRVVRFANEFPEMDGKVSIEDLNVKQYGFEDHPFLEVVEIDGIEYSHYFTSGVMGRPASSAAVVLRERQQSATQGHVQYTDIAMHKKTQQIALFAGTFYSHDEDYLGQQGNCQRRQIIVKHEVNEGRYDPMLVSLKFLEKAYG